MFYRPTVPMQIRHTNIESLSPVAAYPATGTSRRKKPLGLLRSNDSQTLAGSCSR